MNPNHIALYIIVIIMNITGFVILYSSIENISFVYFFSIASCSIWLVVIKKIIIPRIEQNPLSKTKEKEGSI